MTQKSIILSAWAMALTACVSSKNASAPPANQDLVTYNIDLSMTPKPASSAVEALVQDAGAGKPVSFQKITDLLLEKHALKAGKDSVQLASMIAQIAPASAAADNGRKTKIKYETALRALHGGRGMRYNRDAVNVADPLLNERYQCYSGTYLYELVRRRLGATSFRAANEIVIFKAGHVLPGYVDVSADGKTKVIVGIETTQSGGGGQVLATITADSRMTGPIRIVDAEMFALIELISPDRLKDPQKTMRSAMEATAARYGFDIADMREEAASGQGGGGGVAASQMLNSSIFGFGSADVPPGDQPISDSGDDGSLKYADGGGASAMMLNPPALATGADDHDENDQSLEGYYSIQGNVNPPCQVRLSKTKVSHTPSQPDDYFNIDPLSDGCQVGTMSAVPLMTEDWSFQFSPDVDSNGKNRIRKMSQLLYLSPGNLVLQTRNQTEFGASFDRWLLKRNQPETRFNGRPPGLARPSLGEE